MELGIEGIGIGKVLIALRGGGSQILSRVLGRVSVCCSIFCLIMRIGSVLSSIHHNVLSIVSNLFKKWIGMT